MFETSVSEQRSIRMKGELYIIEGTIEGSSNGFSPLTISKRGNRGSTSFGLIYDLELEELIELLQAMRDRLRKKGE